MLGLARRWPSLWPLLAPLCAGVALLLAARAATAQISPGPLSRAHASLEGATNCTSCHKPGSRATFRCLECHTEIASRIAAGRGYHAKVVERDSASQKCATCHSEHNGRDFPVVKWQPSKAQFDHAATGWTLTGKHASVACESCHTAAHVAAAARPTLRVRDLNRTYLGLSTECISCHTDEHRGQLGTNCQQCHNTSNWREVSNFDHSRTRFPLTGAHRTTACEKCHVPSGPDQKPKWSGLVFDRCESCHRDPHRGSFSSTCQTCHSTASWKAVNMTTVNSKFDHASTHFPLLGKHADVACTKCHSGGDFKKHIAFQRCSDCHHPDPHGGQFAKRADGGECSSCHNVNGWKPALFTVADHAKTAYPLVGKHADVACAKCHIPAGTATVYRLKSAHCTDCHADAHHGQFQAAPHLNRCEECHTVKGFHPAVYTLAQHQATRYPLAGAHLTVPCGDCHKPQPGKDYAAFRFPDLNCATCHRDPHRGEFRDRMAKAGADGKPLGCVACHALTSWHDVSKFDHSTTRFPLVGSHRAVGCAECHKPPNLEVTLANVNFRAAPRECEGCHADVHGGQFRRGEGTPCASCHNTNKWKPSIFDHNTRAAFKLEGVHSDVACARCHTNVQEINGERVLLYKPTPKTCEACHGAQVPQPKATL